MNPAAAPFVPSLPPVDTTERSAPFQMTSNFRNPETDIIVQSSDKVDFDVWRGILIEGSVYFRDLLSHYRPFTASTSTRELVPWDEPAVVIDRLLQFLYPIEKTPLHSLDEVVTLIRSADKWQIDFVVNELKKLLVSKQFVDEHALQVYACACEMGFQDVKEDVAVAASESDPCAPGAQVHLAHMTALDLLRLIKLRSSNLPFEEHFDKTSHRGTPRSAIPASSSIPDFQDTDADLRVLSADGAEFGVCKVLSKSSPRLRDMIHNKVQLQPVEADNSRSLTLSWSASTNAQGNDAARG